MTPLKDRILEEVKTAMRAHDSKRLGAIRLISARIKQIEVDKRITADDQEVTAILTKLVKEHQDSIEQYKAGQRPDLVEQEEFELKIIQEFLPPPLPPHEIEQLIQAAITSSGAKGIQDMGKVLGVLRTQVQGRADMGFVSSKVKELLGAKHS